MNVTDESLPRPRRRLLRTVFRRPRNVRKFARRIPSAELIADLVRSMLRRSH